MPADDASGADDGFGLAVPAWRARRLRESLAAQSGAGAAAQGSGARRAAPDELVHRAEIRRWLAGWDRAAAASAEPKPPSARLVARLERWRTGAGRLKGERSDLRAGILDAVADELLAVRPPPFGAIAAAHRETVRRCREAGLPAPKASRYRTWLKVSRGL